MNAEPRLALFDPAVTPPPRELADLFDETDADLTELGFRCLAGVVMPDPLPNVKSIVQLFANESTRDAAMVAAIFAAVPGQQQTLQTFYVEFLTRFDSGQVSLVQTNNSQELGSFPELPGEHTVKFPHIEDTARLYRLHQAAVQRFQPTGRRIVRVLDEFHGDVLAYLREAVFRDEYEKAVGIGYLRYDASGRCFRATIRGAYLMTWKELWPIKPIRRALVRRNARRLEAELGV